MECTAGASFLTFNNECIDGVDEMIEDDVIDEDDLDEDVENDEKEIKFPMKSHPVFVCDWYCSQFHCNYAV